MWLGVFWWQYRVHTAVRSTVVCSYMRKTCERLTTGRQRDTLLLKIVVQVGEALFGLVESIPKGFKRVFTLLI